MPSLDRPFLPVRAALRAAALGLLLLTGPALQAWDADRMLRAAQRQGPAAVATLHLLQPLLREIAPLPDADRVVLVNEFFNRRITFRDDADVWGRADHWASPLETLGKGEGDCEDFAIAKYFTLLAGGLPVERLRLVYVQAQQGGPSGSSVPHMVLAYYPHAGADPLVLDSLITEVRPAARRPDLRPVFSFNSEGLWKGTGADAQHDALAGLSRWRDVLAKARAEGFL